MASMATLTEIREKWSLCDLADAHEALDIQAEAQEFQMRKTHSKGS